MKSIKIKFISALIIGSVLIPTLPTNAAGLSKGIASGLDKQQQRLQNQQLKQQVLQIKQTIKTNDKTNIDLLQQNKQIRQSIRTVINQIKQSKKIITSDDLSKINAQAQVIKDDAAAISATKDSMLTARNTTKNDVQSKNWQDLITQLNSVVSVQGTRTTDLKKLNADLQTLLSIVQTAASNAQAPATSSTSTT